MTPAILLALLTLLTACAPKASPPARSPDVDAETPAMLPTPYTTAQMKAGWVPGTELRFGMSKVGAATTIQRWRVLSHPDDDHVETEFSVFEEDGETPVGQPRTDTASFDELRRHAEFPAALTTAEPATLETPFGTFEGVRYTVTDPATPDIVRVFEFARALPGPPVSMRVRSGGVIIEEMVMLSRTGPVPGGAP